MILDKYIDKTIAITVATNPIRDLTKPLFKPETINIANNNIIPASSNMLKSFHSQSIADFSFTIFQVRIIT